LKVYNEDTSRFDLIKSIGWIIIAMITYFFTEKQIIIYIGILPLLIFIINIWNYKSRKLLLEIDNSQIRIYDKEIQEINSDSYNKIQLEFNNQLKHKRLSYVSIRLSKSKSIEINISSEESYKLIWYIKDNLPMIRLLDKRDNSISKKEKQLKDGIWENGLGFIVSTIFLLVIIYKYDYFLEIRGTSTNSMIFERLVNYIDQLGGKVLMIAIFGYLSLISGLNYIYNKNNSRKPTHNNVYSK